ncbi:urease accessory protein [Aliiroseovarius sediminilitoris]|uniref:Urease accessory protein UreD n=1 Tax=Aliiroseovarius sediminilitoris TaxID=1173584 RepID=A0A1I0MZ21_9RHOB|nr:urease accessory protein UreD [Aliiroseovarius sediminilitoris]SEV93360.1 urease accessory protein [Aliiroseovarius sediminilitoris]
MNLTVVAAGTQTRLRNLRQSGSLKCLFPRKAEGGCEAVLVNTAGGVTGGDRFTVAATAQTDAHLTITTQASERAYASVGEDSGHITSALTVKSGGHLNWLPQETILFNNCHLKRSLHVALEQGASALICEPVIFGRALMGEQLSNAQFEDRVEITRNGKPVFLDQVRLRANIENTLSRPHIAGSNRAMVSLVYIAPDAEARLTTIRSLLPETGAASLIQEDQLVCRILAPDGYLLRKHLLPALNLLTRNQLPKCWII